MATYGFDGVDMALEFEDADIPEDKAALITLLEVCGSDGISGEALLACFFAFRK